MDPAMQAQLLDPKRLLDIDKLMPFLGLLHGGVEPLQVDYDQEYGPSWPCDFTLPRGLLTVSLSHSNDPPRRWEAPSDERRCVPLLVFCNSRSGLRAPEATAGHVQPLLPAPSYLGFGVTHPLFTGDATVWWPVAPVPGIKLFITPYYRGYINCSEELQFAGNAKDATAAAAALASSSAAAAPATSSAAGPRRSPLDGRVKEATLRVGSVVSFTHRVSKQPDAVLQGIVLLTYVRPSSSLTKTTQQKMIAALSDSTEQDKLKAVLPEDMPAAVVAVWLLKRHSDDGRQQMWTGNGNRLLDRVWVGDVLEVLDEGARFPLPIMKRKHRNKKNINCQDELTDPKSTPMRKKAEEWGAFAELEKWLARRVHELWAGQRDSPDTFSSRPFVQWLRSEARKGFDIEGCALARARLFCVRPVLAVPGDLFAPLPAANLTPQQLAEQAARAGELSAKPKRKAQRRRTEARALAADGASAAAAGAPAGDDASSGIGAPAGVNSPAAPVAPSSGTRRASRRHSSSTAPVESASAPAGPAGGGSSAAALKRRSDTPASLVTASGGRDGSRELPAMSLTKMKRSRKSQQVQAEPARSPSEPSEPSDAADDAGYAFFLRLSDVQAVEFNCPLAGWVWENTQLWKDRPTASDDALLEAVREAQLYCWEELPRVDPALRLFCIERGLDSSSTVADASATLATQTWRDELNERVEGPVPKKPPTIVWIYCKGIRPGPKTPSCLAMHRSGIWYGKRAASPAPASQRSSKKTEGASAHKDGGGDSVVASVTIKSGTKRRLKEEFASAAAAVDPRSRSTAAAPPGAPSSSRSTRSSRVPAAAAAAPAQPRRKKSRTDKEGAAVACTTAQSDDSDVDMTDAAHTSSPAAQPSISPAAAAKPATGRKRDRGRPLLTSAAPKPAAVPAMPSASVSVAAPPSSPSAVTVTAAPFAAAAAAPLAAAAAAPLAAAAAAPLAAAAAAPLAAAAAAPAAAADPKIEALEQIVAQTQAQIAQLASQFQQQLQQQQQQQQQQQLLLQQQQALQAQQQAQQPPPPQQQQPPPPPQQQAQQQLVVQALQPLQPPQQQLSGALIARSVSTSPLVTSHRAASNISPTQFLVRARAWCGGRHAVLSALVLSRSRCVPLVPVTFAVHTVRLGTVLAVPRMVCFWSSTLPVPARNSCSCSRWLRPYRLWTSPRSRCRRCSPMRAQRRCEPRM
jgi:hypothetical protein